VTQESLSRSAMLLFQLQQWLRIALPAAGTALAIGAGVFGYLYLTRPVTLTVAAGSADGYAAQIMSSIAARLSQTGSSVRLKVESVGSAFDAAKAFSAGKSISQSFAPISETYQKRARLCSPLTASL
jgi:hypothetical protein